MDSWLLLLVVKEPLAGLPGLWRLPLIRLPPPPSDEAELWWRWDTTVDDPTPPPMDAVT